jgi:hypothetical protein
MEYRAAADRSACAAPGRHRRRRPATIARPSEGDHANRFFILACQQVENDGFELGRLDGAGIAREMMMAVNKPVGDNARKGAVKKRTQLKTSLGGVTAWTKRSKTSGEFMAVKKPAAKKKAAKKFKGVRRER